MSKPVEQALNNIIPRNSGTLPPELIELASSLVAQSRTKATLKPDEEIARTYACANIACERLKTSLDLPPIEPRPPLPTRVYKKLYTHLDQCLTASTPRKRIRSPRSTPGASTPRKRSSQPQQTSLPQRHTPSKEKSLDGFRENNRKGRRGLLYGNKSENEGKIPRWVAPVVRMLCKQTQSRTAIPHVLAGVESVLCLPPPELNSTDKKGKRERARPMDCKLPAIVAGVWFWVLKEIQDGGYVNSDTIRTRTQTVLEEFAGVRSNGEVLLKVGNENTDWERWEEITKNDIHEAIERLADDGWCRMEWFNNIEEGKDLDDIVEDEQDDDNDDNDDDIASTSREQIHRAGLGSMKQERYNYLSEKNRRDYKIWKRSILNEMDVLIKQGAVDQEMSL